MNAINKSIVESYLSLISSLNELDKLELLRKLSVSLKKTTTADKSKFFNTFGAFPDDRPVEDIVKEIKESRSFQRKDIQF